jgi:prephenate dehydrogenase
MKNIGLIGYGRFGRMFANILADDFKVFVYDLIKSDVPDNVEFTDILTVSNQKTIFIAVPIRSFKSVIQSINPNIKKGTTVIDVCSVKVYPESVMKDNLAEDVGIIATHPLFGPDSIDHKEVLKIMMHPTRDHYQVYEEWKDYFDSKSIRVIDMSPEEHDRLAAKTQGLTHFVGRVLEESGITSTDIDTQGYVELRAVIDQTCNDSWELFSDLQNYNPHTIAMIKELERAMATIRRLIVGGERHVSNINS